MGITLKAKTVMLGDTHADARAATAKAKELDPTAEAVRADVYGRAEDKCQIRITDFDWDEDGTMVEYQGIAASGRNFTDALIKFYNWIEEKKAAEKAGDEAQRKLREQGL